MARFADIVLPLAQPLYTFAIAEDEVPQLGDAVAVQFGAKAIYTGIVWRLHDTPPAKGVAKTLGAVLYDRPLLSPLQMRFWEWIAKYYMCHLGEVMRVALPSLIKPHARQASDFEPYTPRQQRMIGLGDEHHIEEYLDKHARRAPKRAALIAQLRSAGGSIPRNATTLDAAALTAMAKADVIRLYERNYTPALHEYSPQLPALSTVQQQTLDQILQGLTRHDTALLYGVTGSGKTEIYTHLIADTLARGEDVLYLVPEISLTTQLVERLERLFGECVTPYHSKLTPARRTKIYTDMLHAPSGNFIIGARSAIFLPYRHLGLVVVDEEHDASYKQSEPNPRYNGRDAAIMLSRMHGAKSLLGTATPSLESYANTLSGKYAMVRLAERYGESQLPDIIISDTLRNAKRNERREQFNKELIDRIEERLARGEQIILFQNRRGYSPYIECGECGWAARCPHCNVTLTQHRNSGVMRCHYCGHSTPIPRLCPSCKVAELQPMGFGTERVELTCAKLFPTARIARLDGDTAVSESAYRRIISSFARHEVDILIGTQIVSKGLDFDNVTLIGVLNADNLLNAPDFRASERSWQLLQQVAGRCGRRADRGEVVIQTAEPTHPLYARLRHQEFEEYAATLLAERKMFNYPPFARIINISLRDTDVRRLADTASLLGQLLRQNFGGRIIGPASPLVDRVRNQHRLEITLKVENAASFAQAKERLCQCIEQLRRDKRMRKVIIICDVDA